MARARQELAKASRLGGNFQSPRGNLAKDGQDVLDDILTTPGVKVDPVQRGNFAGGRCYVTPDG
jgi:hypothetical protein